RIKGIVCHLGLSILPCVDFVSLLSCSLSSEEPFCRICHEGGGVGELLSPCECAGTLAMVHRGCLEHWLTASNSSRCELCHHQYSLERLPKPLTEWLGSPAMQHQRRTLCGDVICFLFITPLASLSGWLCVQGSMDLYYSNSMEAVGLMVLTLALFTIYCFWTVVSCGAVVGCGLHWDCLIALTLADPIDFHSLLSVRDDGVDQSQLLLGSFLFKNVSRFLYV
uniref:Membrane associated ring-CH-type finger 3 n=1 Tax=Hucho hucho TaxID=62062 RepID=A0A4W5P918_9TELE